MAIYMPQITDVVAMCTTNLRNVICNIPDWNNNCKLIKGSIYSQSSTHKCRHDDF